MAVDPFGRALRDHSLGTQEEPLVQRDGDAAIDHPVGANYFGTRDVDRPGDAWLASWVDGPLLDAGAGVGRDALFFQGRVETVAIEVSEALVETMRDRGVDDARLGDLFDLPSSFPPDRFRSVIAIGTQVGLVGSMAGLGALLDDLALVTDSAGTVVFDNLDPTHPSAPDLLGFRPSEAPGLARRSFHFEYAGEVGPTLELLLFGPDRLREAMAGTDWRLADVLRGPREGPHYLAALTRT